MRKLNLLHLLVLLLAILLTSCAGSVREPGDPGGDDLPELEYDLVTDEESSVDAEDVDGEMLEPDDALDARDTSALPGGYRGVQGLHFTPHTPPGGGFSGQLTVRITYPGTQANEYEGVRLFLFYVDPDTLATTQVDSARATSGNWITFQLDALGFFVIAENLSIPRPGTTFTVAAFADLSLTTTGTTINFSAVPTGGTEPISYEWDMADGTQLSGQSVSHAYGSAGTYNVILTATDADGDVAPTTSTPIEVSSTAVPLDSVTINATQGTSALEWQFSATVAGGNPPLSYAWDFDSDGTDDSTEAAPNFSFPAPGVYEAVLTVTDALDASVSDTHIVDARSIDFFGTPTDGEAPLVVDFSQSDYQIGALDELTIDFGDGSIVNSAALAAQHTYDVPGTYTATASASADFNGQTFTVSGEAVTVVVEAPSTSPYIQMSQPLVLSSNSLGFDLYGFNFGDSQGTSSINAGGVALSVESWTDERINIGFDTTPSVEQITILLNTPEGPSNSIKITLNETAIPAAIQNVIADYNFPGAPLLVVGHGFGTDPETVTINGTIATVEQWDDNAILLSMPQGVAAGAATLHIAIDGVSDFTFNLRTGFAIAPELLAVDPPARVYGGNDPDTEFTGTGFSALSSGKSVYSDGLLLPVQSWSDESIFTTDPSRPYSGWSVVLRLKMPSNALDSASIPQPFIESLLPPEASVGEFVRIQGSGFDIQAPGDVVTLNGLELPVQTWSDTQIMVQIPEGANDGEVFVEKSLISNGVFLNVLPPTPPPPGGGQV